MFSAKVFHYFYPRFIEVLHSYFEKAFDERITGDEVKVDWELFINYILFAYLGVLRYWIQEGMRKSPEYMGEQIKVLLTMTPFEFRELPKG
jgi:hypothetical protein